MRIDYPKLCNMTHALSLSICHFVLKYVLCDDSFGRDKFLST